MPVSKAEVCYAIYRKRSVQLDIWFLERGYSQLNTILMIFETSFGFFFRLGTNA
jgi:hypothetical protein